MGVAWFGDEAAFQGFIDRHGLTFPQISDDPGEVFTRFEVPAQPALVLVDTDGRVERVLGAIEPDELDALFSSATS